MATGAWLTTGKIAVTAGGTVWVCGHCPCGEGVPCCPGKTLSEVLYLTVTDDGSGTLALCPCVGGTFVLNRSPPGTGYRWGSDPFACAGYTPGRWSVVCSPPGIFGPFTRWRLFFSCDDGDFTGPTLVGQWDDHCDPFGSSGTSGISLLGDFGHNARNCCDGPLVDPPFGATFDWTVGP